MATSRFFTTRFLLSTKHIITVSPLFSRSYTSLSLSTPPSSLSSISNSSSLLRLRSLAAVAAHFHLPSPAPTTIRGFSTRRKPESSSVTDPKPNSIQADDGCDFEHWLVVMENPEGDPSRDEIIDSYIKTLAMVVGSEEEARKKIYSVSTKHYYAFGAHVSEYTSYKIKELPRVRWVLPDAYLDV